MGVSPRKQTEPVAWEYKTCTPGEANQYGKEGWSAYAALVEGYGVRIYMKRGLK